MLGTIMAKVSSDCGRSARLSQTNLESKGSGRGRSHRPNGAESGRNQTVSRVLTVRIMPAKEQWSILRERSSEAANYGNRHAQAKLAELLGWRVPEESKKDSLTKHVRTGEQREKIKARLISANCYSSAEGLVRADFTRKNDSGVPGWKRYMAGARLPQYLGNSLGIATISGAPGVKIAHDGDGGFMAGLHVTADKQESPTWEWMPIHKKTFRDQLAWPKLRQFADGNLSVSNARVIFKNSGGKVLLQLCHAVQFNCPPPGERVATVSMSEVEHEGEKYARLQVRDESDCLDLTGELHSFRLRKAKVDAYRRRIAIQIGKGRGSRRAKLKAYERCDMRDFTRTWCQQIASKALKWAADRHCGTVRILDLAGGDWPADKFAFFLKSSGERMGIKTEEVKLDSKPSDSSDRAAKAETRRAMRRRRKLNDAVLEINHQQEMRNE